MPWCFDRASEGLLLGMRMCCLAVSFPLCLVKYRRFDIFLSRRLVMVLADCRHSGGSIMM